MFRVIRTLLGGERDYKIVELPYILAAGETIAGSSTFANRTGAEHFKAVLQSKNRLIRA